MSDGGGGAINIENKGPALGPSGNKWTQSNWEEFHAKLRFAFKLVLFAV